ncbi:MAG: RsiV family protein [Patescibacteria group bacterium]
MDTKSTSIVGVIILGVISLGLVLWYMSEHPAPYVRNPDGAVPGTATTTPTAPDKTLSENGRYYDITAVYPSVTPLKASASARADAQAIEVMKQFELNTISAFKEQGNFDHLTAEDISMLGFDQGRKESLEITYVLKRGGTTLSYLYTMYQDTLGAHPNAYFRSFTFNSKTGEGLDLTDVFAPGTDYLKLLSTISRKKLPTIIAKTEGMQGVEVDVDYMNRGTTPDADNFQNWYIDGTSLVLLFPPYQVAAYAAGVQTVSIPFSELGTSVRASYR